MFVSMKEMLEDARFKTLDTLVKQNNGLWNGAAEKYLLEIF